MYLILLGLGVPAGVETLVLAVFTLSFSTIIGAVSALPGGLGAAELSIAGMLSFLLGLDGGTAGAATLLIRFATLWFGVGLGLAVWTRSGDWLLLEARTTRTSGSIRLIRFARTHDETLACRTPLPHVPLRRQPDDPG